VNPNKKKTEFTHRNVCSFFYAMNNCFDTVGKNKEKINKKSIFFLSQKLFILAQDFFLAVKNLCTKK